MSDENQQDAVQGTKDLPEQTSPKCSNEEKPIDDILWGMDQDKKERKNVDDDKESDTKRNVHDRYAHGKEGGEAGTKGAQDPAEVGDEATSASDQGDTKGRGTGAVESNEEDSSNVGSKSEAETRSEVDHPDDTQIKLQEELTRNKKWGHDLARKLKSYQSKLESYVADGKITLDEAKDLYAETTHDDLIQEESLYDTYAKIWDQEIENIRKYAPDDNLDKHIMGFQAKMKLSSPDEISKLFAAFKGEKDPVRLTRSMLKEGSTYYDTVLSKVDPHGGMEGYISHMEKSLKRAQDKVDSLKEEVVNLKSEGYMTSAGYSLPSHGDKGQYQKDMTLDSVFTRARQGQI